MTHRGIGTVVLLLFTMACGGGATPTPETPLTTAEPDSPFTEVTRSILGIIPAVDIGEDGQPVEPGFIFSPDTPKITIVAHAGEVTGSTMDLKWFQVTDAGEVELFTHSVELASFEAAYSVGTNPGTLLAGTYRVDATFETETSSTTFEVEAPESEAAIALSAGAGAREASAIGQGTTSGPPEPGASGTMPTPTAGVGEHGPEVELVVYAPVVPGRPGPPGIPVGFRAHLPGGNGDVDVLASMGGNTRLVRYPLAAGQELVADELDFNPCVHPGGSDLPGTLAEFSVNIFRTGDTVAAHEKIATTLGPDTTKPVVTIISEPHDGSRVEPGDEIVLDAQALEQRDGPTWQEGLNSFKLIARPGGQVGDLIRSTAGSPQPCDSKQWTLELQATYTVPDDAPAVIKICGEALDFAGNFSRPDACNEYHTGEATISGLTGSWTWSRDITTNTAPGYTNTDLQITDATFSLAAVGENRLEGQGHMSYTRSYSYRAPTDCPYGTGDESVEWDVFYEAELVVNSDGSINVDITGTPRFGPDYVSTLTYPDCPELNFTNTLSGPATVDILGITIVNDEYNYREDSELAENQTGEDYVEVIVHASY